MRLKKLLQSIPSIKVKDYKDVDITSLCNNSKKAAPGSLFFAKTGGSHNGNTFTAEAISAGALAIVTDLYNPFLSPITQIIHPDVAYVESILADRFYESPSHKLLTIGITGTNGKTTTSYLIKHLLDTLHIPCGLIGTIEWIVKDNVFPSTHTTPDLLTNQKLLHDMVTSGCKSVVMEVSSHGLDQGRVRSLDFDFAIFTNFTQDHLDYHGDMPSYAEAKKKLFSSLTPSAYKPYPKTAIINIDSPWASTFMQATKVDTFSYGLSPQASLQALNPHLSVSGVSCTMNYLGKGLPFHTSLIGTFNLYNCLATISVGLLLGYPLENLLSILASFTGVPGRMERVSSTKGKHIFVDYAHTEDALLNVLSTLKELSPGKIICVFGCGGNRDPWKRPKMGAIAEKMADVVILTSDNPRNEDPKAIIEDILSGMTQKSQVQIEIDRKKAIGLAIDRLSANDVLLIAGKGHENYQIFSDQTIPFDDRRIAQSYCQ